MRVWGWLVLLAVGPGWSAESTDALDGPLTETARWLVETAQGAGLELVGVAEFAHHESTAGAAGRYLAERLATLASGQAPGRWLGPAALADALGEAVGAGEPSELQAERLARVPRLGGMVTGSLSVTAQTALLELSFRPLAGGAPAERGVELPMTADLLVLLGVNAAVAERRGLRPRLEELADLAIVAPSESPAPALSANCPFSLEVLVDGEPRPRLIRAGGPVVRMQEDEVYRLRLGNHSAERVGVALFVDGLNSIGQQLDSPARAVKWLLEPGQSVVVPGWQMSDRKAREFVVVSPEASLAARHRLSHELGLITAAFYAEAPKVAVAVPPGEERRDLPLGTGEGATHPSSVRRVTFQAAEVPAAILTLRYERAAAAEQPPR